MLQHAVDTLRSVCAVTVTVQPDQLRQARRVVPADVELSSAEDFWTDPPDRVLVHDSLCPLVPAEFLERLASAEQPTAAYRPVTDTLKVVEDDVVGRTIDREQFGILTSPVLVLGATGADRPPTEDVGRLVGWLRERGAVELVLAPQAGRRAVDRASVSVLESLDAVRRTVRQGPPAHS
jgi:2-C-methyl-D-erythritol 4-phosphate cytidylyltransferase